MTAMAPLPKDAPVMVAWEAYKASEDYVNTRQWAAQLAHTDGSLWAAFYAGHASAIVDQSPKGRDRNGLDAKHAGAGGEANRPNSGAMTQDTEKLAARAIFDPGYFVPRNEGETMWDWQARACVAAVPNWRTPPTDTPDGELAREVDPTAARIAIATDMRRQGATRMLLTVTETGYSASFDHGIPSRLTPSGMTEQVREAAAKVVEDYADFAPGDDLPLGTAQAFLHGAMNAIRAMPLPKSSDKTTVADDGLLDRARVLAGMEVEGDCDNPLRVNEARAFYEGARDDHPLMQKHLAALQREGGSDNAVRELLREARDALGDENCTCDLMYTCGSCAAKSELHTRIDAALSASSGNDTVGVAK